MKSYITKTGDTLENISRRFFGDESHVELIRNSNPGLSSDLPNNTDLNIPIRTPISTSSAIEGNEVTILIDGKEFRYWTEININMIVDGIDSIDFRSPYDTSNTEFSQIFTPFSFKPISILVGGELLFTGTIMSVTPELTESTNTVLVSCYSQPGVLNDCTAPASLFPLEFNDVNLLTICQRLCEPFGFTAISDQPTTPAFESVVLKPGGEILPFLTKLAKQKNLIISNDNKGDLLLTKTTVSKNLAATLNEDLPSIKSIRAIFNTQNYFSHITGLTPALVGIDGSQHTVRNKHLSGVLRPHVFDAEDVDNGELKTAVESKLARVFANAVEYTVELPTWRNALGQLWAPNTSISLHYPRAFINNPYTFIIREVKFIKTAQSENASLSVVLPGVFNGQIPETLPWDL